MTVDQRKQLQLAVEEKRDMDGLRWAVVVMVVVCVWWCVCVCWDGRQQICLEQLKTDLPQHHAQHYCHSQIHTRGRRIQSCRSRGGEWCGCRSRVLGQPRPATAPPPPATTPPPHQPMHASATARLGTTGFCTPARAGGGSVLRFTCCAHFPCLSGSPLRSSSVGFT